MAIPSTAYTHAKELYDANQDNLRRFEEMEKCYSLDWSFMPDDDPTKTWIIDVKDPQPFMSVRWLVEIMAGTFPLFRITVPQEALTFEPSENYKRFRGALRRFLPEWVSRLFRQPSDAERVGSHLSRFIGQVIRQVDARRQTSLLENILLAGFVHGRMAVKFVDLRQNRQWQKENQPDMDVEAAASDWTNIQSVPIMLEPVDVKTVHPEWDSMGLCAVLHRYTRKARDIQRVYGKKVPNTEPGDMVVFNEFWTREKKYAWVDKGVVRQENIDMAMTDDINPDEVFMLDAGDNAYGFVPFAIRDAYSNDVLTDTAPTPLLYAGAKTKVFERSSLLLTVMTTLAFRTANPQWAQVNVPEGEEAISLDLTQPNVYPLGPGQAMTNLNIPVNEYLITMLDNMDGKAQETTVAHLIAGQRPGGVTAASALNLLTQGNKLQVVPVEKATRLLFIDIARLIFGAIKAYDDIEPESAVFTLWTKEGRIEVDPSQLPVYFDIDVFMEVNMPQDRAALINTAINAWKSKAIPLRTAHRWMGLDPDEEERLMELEQAKGIAPSIAHLGGMSTQEGVLPGQPAINPMSQAGATPPNPTEAEQNTTNVGGGG